MPEGFLAHMPEELSFEEAAALPLAALAAHQCLELLGLRGGETLFLTGGAGGVGHIAIQLALARGARVIASASPDNLDFLRELGAEPLDYHDEALPSASASSPTAAAPTPPSTSSAATARSRPSRALRHGGRLVSIATPAGEARALRDRLHLRPPLRLRPRRAHHPARAAGGLRPHIAATFPLEEAAAAHEQLEAGHVRGKLVLTILS